VEQSGESNIYDPNGRALKVTFPNLDVGDVSDITYRLTRSTPTRPGFFNDSFAFQSTAPILESTYEVNGPASLPLTSVIYHPERAPQLESKKLIEGDRILYSWSLKRAPQLVPEAEMNFMSELPILVLSTDPSWQHFSAWWAQLSEPELEATPAIKAKVKELTATATSDEGKIRALYDFVAQDIRYRGLGVGPRTGYTPRKADDTFTSRWGVCRDVAILLTSMLRESGFQAYPVLTNVGDPVLDKVAYDGFNHAIVAMPKPGGGWTFLDPTAKNNSALLPANEAEQQVLVATLQGEPLSQIPPLAPSANLGHTSAQTVLFADGSMTSQVKVATKGAFDLLLRSVAAQMSTDQQRELLESLLHRALPDAELVSFQLSSALLLWEPMTLDIAIRVPNAAPRVGKFRLARTLVTSGALGIVENLLPRAFGTLESRKYGLDAHVTFEYDQEESVTLPPELQVLALPNPASASSKIAQLSATCTKTSPTALECKRSFQLESRFVDPNGYQELRRAFANLSQIARQPIILTGGV
jgi:transglutaminase-like putative cysteine protease